MEEIEIIIYLEHSPQNGQNSVKSETQTVLGAMYKLSYLYIFFWNSVCLDVCPHK